MVIRRFALALMVPGALASALALVGCYEDNCDIRGTCPVLEVPVTWRPAAECNPSSEVAQDGCGVFVSSSTGTEGGDGSRRSPVSTFDRAIKLAGNGTSTIYACAEEFHEALVVPAGVRLIGGLDCATDWKTVGSKRKTEVIAPPDQIALRVSPGAGPGVDPVADRVQLVDMRIRAVDATVPGGSSIAAIVPDGTSASFLRCELVAGNGADGVDGEPGDVQSAVAKPGIPGHTGASACSGPEPQGGAPVKTECEDGLASEGGFGGNGGPESGFSGTDGTPGPASNPDGAGASGIGQLNDASCSNGTDGARGAHGTHGDGGHGIGTLDASGFAGVKGGDGSRGMPGQGGGGGGGSRGGMLLCFKPNGGAAGGSGGAGGCGGRGGGGGGFGGASIALLLGEAIIEMTESGLITGNGGDGGSGGMLQLGGQGGVQGLGGKMLGKDTGCSGGAGGDGGNGGYGGGGTGGPSVGIAHTAPLPVLDIAYSKIGKSGNGGWGGNPNLFWTNGDQGVTGVAFWWK